MKKIDGKLYLEVVGAESTSGIVTNDAAVVSSWIVQGTVKRFLDKQSMQLMSAMDLGHNWNRMSGSTVFLYFCEADGSTVSPLDIEYTYKVNDTPMTALELIKEAERLCRIDCATTQQAAMALRSIGKAVDVNTNPTNKRNIL